MKLGQKAGLDTFGCRKRKKMGFVNDLDFETFIKKGGLSRKLMSTCLGTGSLTDQDLHTSCSGVADDAPPCTHMHDAKLDEVSGKTAQLLLIM